LVEMALTMLVCAGPDESFLAEAIKTPSYLTLPGLTPFEIWTGRKPYFGHLSVFGANAIVLNKTHKTKFAPKGEEHILVGYSETANAYRLYSHEKRKMIEARDVMFFEDDLGRSSLPGKLRDKSSLVVGELSNNPPSVEPGAGDDELASIEQEPEDVDPKNAQLEEKVAQRAPGRPKLVRTGLPGRPRKEYQMMNVLTTEDIAFSGSFKEAMNGDHIDTWKASVQKEMYGLRANKTWSLVDLPKGEKTICCRWVFALKRYKNGHIERFKSRLVTKGCAQRQGIIYFETFSSVARYSTIRLVIASAVEHGMFMHQMDVSSAYLNRELRDVEYMRQPEVS